MRLTYPPHEMVLRHDKMYLSCTLQNAYADYSRFLDAGAL